MNLHWPTGLDLIDTLWNVKGKSEKAGKSSKIRFNRYIVECKGCLHYRGNARKLGFNRYIVECKAVCGVRTACDVRRFNRYIVECKVRFSFFILCHYYRFNRYIVECKGWRRSDQSPDQCDLIDTLWNVKMQLMQQMFNGDPDLIDTLWNVKGHGWWCSSSCSLGFNRYIVECKVA